MFFDWFGVEVSGVGGFSGQRLGRGRQRLGRARIHPDRPRRSRSSPRSCVAVLRLTDSTYEPPISMNAVVTVLGVFSVLLILFRIVDPPCFASFGGVSVDGTLDLGIFLGLIAAGRNRLRRLQRDARGRDHLRRCGRSSFGWGTWRSPASPASLSASCVLDPASSATTSVESAVAAPSSVTSPREVALESRA